MYRSLPAWLVVTAVTAADGRHVGCPSRFQPCTRDPNSRAGTGNIPSCPTPLHRSGPGAVLDPPPAAKKGASSVGLAGCSQPGRPPVRPVGLAPCRTNPAGRPHLSRPSPGKSASSASTCMPRLPSQSDDEDDDDEGDGALSAAASAAIQAAAAPTGCTAAAAAAATACRLPTSISRPARFPSPSPSSPSPTSPSRAVLANSPSAVEASRPAAAAAPRRPGRRALPCGAPPAAPGAAIRCSNISGSKFSIRSSRTDLLSDASSPYTPSSSSSTPSSSGMSSSVPGLSNPLLTSAPPPPPPPPSTGGRAPAGGGSSGGAMSRFSRPHSSPSAPLMPCGCVAMCMVNVRQMYGPGGP
jgi:hypothetical protein